MANSTPRPGWIESGARVFSVLAVLGLLIGACVVVGDVLGRWLFGTAVVALNEIMEFVFAIAIAATLPAGAAMRVNLKVDLLGNTTGARLTGWLTALGSLALAVFFALLAYRVWGLAARYDRAGRATSILYLPLAPAYFTIAGLLAITAALQLRNAVQDMARAFALRSTERSGPITLIVIVLFLVSAVAIGLWTWLDMRGISRFVVENPGTTAVAAFAFLWLAVLAQMPLASVTGLIGVVGSGYFMSAQAAQNVFASNAMEFLTNSQVATLPLFMMMGSFAVAAGISDDLYRLANAFLGRVRGGLAYATVAGCAGFGAVSGSSVATSATFGRIALPEMERRGYAATLAAGSVAAGGTLGALVPPSGAIILFALLTEESIARLFVAAMVPALLAVVLYFAAIWITLRLNPGLAPDADVRRDGRSDILPAIRAALPVILLFSVVIGGLYGGIFTATESAAVGAVGAFILTLARGRLNRATVLEIFAQTTATTAMVYALIFGALMFSFFVNLGQTPEMVANWIGGLNAAPILILIALLVFYLVLGSVMDSFAVMVITVPVVTPLILDMGYDMLFWGVLMLVIVETGMITPPFGMNLFIIKSVKQDVALGTVMRGVMPFILADLVKLVLLVAIPALSLWLPSTMN